MSSSPPTIFITATYLAIIFALFRLAERRLFRGPTSTEETGEDGSEEGASQKPIRTIAKDSVIVFFVVLAAYYGLERITPVFRFSESSGDYLPVVFTGDPDF